MRESDETYAEAGFLQASLEVEPDGLLVITARRGRVWVTSHDGEEVRVHAEARGPGADQVVFVLERDGDDAYFEVDCERGWRGMFNRARVDVRIWVPRRYSLDVRTAGGAIRLEEICGSVVTQSSGGRQLFRRIAGVLEVHSSGGSIRAEQIRGDLETKTSSGSVEIADIEGDVTLKSSGGRIRIDGLDGMLEARTSGGSVTVDFTDQPEGAIETSGGSVSVGFPSTASCSIDARTSGGSIDCEHPLAGSGRCDRRRLVGDLNGGGPMLRLRTSGGSIRLRRS